MITYLKGNIFFSPADVLVNPVNTVGVMGKGIAADFKKKYPDMFKKYKNFCDKKQFSVGELLLLPESDYKILLFPTKKHWRGSSKIEYIELGLQKFVDTYEKKKINSIAFPLLGCGWGNLSWENDVKPLMEKYLYDLPIDIYIYVNSEKFTKNTDLNFFHKINFSTNELIEFLNEHKKSDFKVNLQNTPYDVIVSQNNLFFENKKDNEDVIEISKEFLDITFDKVKKQNIISTANEDTQSLLIYFLLDIFGYISEVFILDEFENFTKGFQLNRGAIRISDNNIKKSQNFQLSLF